MPEAVRIVERAEVLLADGTVEVLGPFGATAQAPLRSLTLQQLVPKLFELAGSDAAQRCAQATPWPACYRLDALIATATHEPNLAQFSSPSDQSKMLSETKLCCSLRHTLTKNSSSS
jgi:hypothetical protein